MLETFKSIMNWIFNIFTYEIRFDKYSFDLLSIVIFSSVVIIGSWFIGKMKE